MKLIVECGASKSDWRLVGDGGVPVRRVVTPGINVSSMKREEIEAVIRDAFGQIEHPVTEGIYMYVAGVLTPFITEWLTSCLRTMSAAGEIEVWNDLIAAARSLFGETSGIVAILGTGSNACMYDGHEVFQKVWSGGYVLGDDGGADALGRIFLSDFIKGMVPENVGRAFVAETGADYASIIEKVYHSPSPAGYLGSLAPFIISHYDDAYVRSIVDRNFSAFIERMLGKYDTDTYKVGVVGGFGNACRDIFTFLAGKAGIRIAGYVPSPVEELVKYHTKENAEIVANPRTM